MDQKKIDANGIIAIAAIIGLLLTANQIGLTSKQFEQQSNLTREQFRQENRPFIEIREPQISFLRGFVHDNQYPALQFAVSADLVNHGKSPAYISRTSFILESLDKSVAKPFMPTPEDQEKYISSIDIFPRGKQTLSWSPFLNFNDIGELVSVGSDTVKSVKELMMRIKQGIPAEPSTINVKTKDCYLIVQTQYSNLSSLKKNYFYSARFRVDLSDKFKCRRVGSKIGENEETGYWYRVGSKSELTPIADNINNKMTVKEPAGSTNWIAIGFILVLMVIYFGAVCLVFRNELMQIIRVSRNKQQRLILACVYGAFGIVIILLCLYVNFKDFFLLPKSFVVDLFRRLIWCIGWSCMGFSLAAAYSIRSKNDLSPFPSYFYHYPLRLLTNSFLGFGLLSLAPSDGRFIFYPITAWICFGLGLAVDWAHFKNLTDFFFSLFRLRPRA